MLKLTVTPVGEAGGAVVAVQARAALVVTGAYGELAERHLPLAWAVKLVGWLGTGKVAQGS
jgi:hypothetical protein